MEKDKVYISGGVGLFLSKEETSRMAHRFIEKEMPVQKDTKPSLFDISEIIETECEGEFLTSEKTANVKILPLTDDAKAFVDSVKDWVNCSFFHSDTEYALLPYARDNDEIINTICQEFKKYLGKYLPDDFDYRKHIVDFTGIYYDEDAILKHRDEKNASYESEVIKKFIDALESELISDEVEAGILTRADAGTVIGCARYMLSEGIFTKEDCR